MTDRPTIVCLCGSTRFYDEFQQANYDLTMRGEIVLSVGFYPHAKVEHGHGEGVGHDSAEKVALDELHKRKIDLADYVYVLNVGGYIGDSTRSEIEYAEQIGKPVRYLVAHPTDDNRTRGAAMSNAESISEAFQEVRRRVGGFAAEMRAQGIHVGINGRCVCGTPWPCSGSDPATADPEQKEAST